MVARGSTAPTATAACALDSGASAQPVAAASVRASAARLASASWRETRQGAGLRRGFTDRRYHGRVERLRRATDGARCGNVFAVDLSVVIPTRNRPTALVDCLRAVKAASENYRVETLVM